MKINEWNWDYFQRILDSSDWDELETFYISLGVQERGIIKLFENWQGRLDQPTILLNSSQEQLLKQVEAKAKEYVEVLEFFKCPVAA